MILFWRGDFDSSLPPETVSEFRSAALSQAPSFSPAFPLVMGNTSRSNTGLLPTITPTPKLPTSTPLPIPVLYTVEQGDVAIGIAEKYGISTEMLLAANNIADPTKLQVGQQLNIPVMSTPVVVVTSTPIASPTPTVESVYHSVEAGDTLLAMAITYDISVEAIMLVNEIIDPQRLQIGQELLIPPKNANLDAKTPTTIHAINEGDTLLALAALYGSTLDDIQAANPELEPTSLQIGQKIVIPITQRMVSQAIKPALPKIITPIESSPNLITLEQQIIEATNAQRQAQGMPPYVADAQLNSVARAHAQDMVLRGYFSHTSPEGQRVRDRLQARGLYLNWVGENILQSTRPAGETPRYAINWFMADRPHRLNLMHHNYNRIGVGVAQGSSGWYTIVQVFAEK